VFPFKFGFALEVFKSKCQETHKSPLFNQADVLAFEDILLAAWDAADASWMLVDAHKVYRTEGAILADPGGDERGNETSRRGKYGRL